MRSSARFRASRPDCLEEEEEETTAELLPLADLLREACVDGGVQRRLGQLAVMAPLGLGFPARGKRRVRESSTSRGAFLTSMGGQGATRSAGTTRRCGGHGDSGSPVATVKMVRTV